MTYSSLLGPMGGFCGNRVLFVGSFLSSILNWNEIIIVNRANELLEQSYAIFCFFCK